MGGEIRRQGRRLEHWLLVGGLMGVCALAVAILVGAAAVNTISRGWEQEQLANGLKSRIGELQASVFPQVNWDDAVQNVQNHYDPKWVESNLGAYLTQTAGFQDVYVLDAADRPTFAVRDGEPAESVAYAEVGAIVAPLVDKVRALEARRGPFNVAGPSKDMISTAIQATTVGSVGGKPLILMASLVQPDFGVFAPIGPRAPIVVTGRAIDAQFVDELENRYLIADAHLSAPTAARAPGEAQAMIADVHGRPIAALRWSPRQPGAELVRRIAGVLILTLALLVGAIFLTQRAARRAFADLFRSEDALRAALVRAEAADRAKSEFLASISHEIRTPLNSVFGALHLLKSEPISRDGATLIDNALASGQMVGALINDVLDFSKIAAGAMTVTPEPTDVAALLESVRAAFAPGCEAKGLALELDVGPGMGWRSLDGLRLRQCLFNLIGNACKFTERGGVVVTARIDGETLDVRVRDTGVGIAPEAIASLFDRFTQADSSMTRRYGGAGLGLAITRQLAGLMGGAVDVESRPGEGSTFRLTIAAPPAAPLRSEAVDFDSAPLAGVALLLVDDNAANLTIGAKILERLGANVATADGGEAALEQLSGHPYDLVLMDIQMPGIDGLETTRRLRASAGVNARTPVIALTANVLDGQRQAYAAAGMAGVVAKPIVPVDLLREILNVAAGGEGEDAVEAA